MKRFHVHVGVEDLDASVSFYSTVFGIPPSVPQSNYAKWMLEDPRLSFAISTHGAPPGLDHLGFQVDRDEELAELRALVERAQMPAVDQIGARCCYALADKYWITDPQGIARETFRSLASIPVYGADVRRQQTLATPVASCCEPAPSTGPVMVPFTPARVGAGRETRPRSAEG
jgi:catechol 2,3-dioxygenase-like lactoylglutathione lyase family enzyme